VAIFPFAFLAPFLNTKFDSIQQYSNNFLITKHLLYEASKNSEKIQTAFLDDGFGFYFLQ